MTQKRAIQSSNIIRSILKNTIETKPFYSNCKQNYLIMDIISVYYLFMQVSNNQEIKDEIYNEMKEKVIKRFFKNNYYIKNMNMTNCMKLLDKAINIMK